MSSRHVNPWFLGLSLPKMDPARRSRRGRSETELHVATVTPYDVGVSWARLVALKPCERFA